MTKFFVYSYWTSDGSQTIQGFYKPEKAADFALAKINDLVAYEERNHHNSKPAKQPRGYINILLSPQVEEPAKLPIELQTLRQRITDLTGKPITVSDALALIDLYEDYCIHVAGHSSPLHTIQEIPVVE